MIFRTIPLLTILFCAAAGAEPGDLAVPLSKTYNAWRQAMLAKDARQWSTLTAPHRQMEIRNRLASEKRPFPASVFEVPVQPPRIDNLELLHVSQKLATAKLSFFGSIDFGVGGEPTKNLLVLSFVSLQGRWSYDRADYVNLSALPEVRKELEAGTLKYLAETPECQATGIVPPVPMQMPQAKYIAKVYVFCPGREVLVQVNRISRHRFANAKEAEIVLGGARDGRNEITFTSKSLEGSTGKEPFAVRVYLLSEVPGTNPIIAYEFKAEEGQPVKALDSGQFVVDAATAAKLVR